MSSYARNSLVIFVAIAMISGCTSAPEILEPSCDNPAPLDGKFDSRVQGYIAMFVNDGIDAGATTGELARKYSFTPESIFGSIKGFSVQALTPQALAGLRCEPSIRGISFNQQTRITSNALKAI
jgi:hypothetical protein